VNRLSAISTALTIAIILNIRKFTSLALSVAVFGNPLSIGVKVGATLVAAGAAWYAFESRGRGPKRYLHLLALSIWQYLLFERVLMASRANGGLLSKSWQEMSILPQSKAQSPRTPPRLVLPQQYDPNSSQGTSTVGTPLAELVDRNELKDLHSGNAAISEDGRPRKRSIGEHMG
jgi:hypothetical protein